MKTNNHSKFTLGQTLITPNAQSTLHPADIILSLSRHAGGDWGLCDPDDWAANEAAILNGLRIFSVYQDRLGSKFWIITEADRTFTTVLLPEDY